MNDLLSRAYQILKLPEGASREDVERAYRSLVDSVRKGEGRWDDVKEIDSAFQLLMEHLSPAVRACPEDKILLERTDQLEKHHTAGFNLKELLFPSEEEVSSLSFWGRTSFFMIILFWGTLFIFAPIDDDSLGRSFMHLINLPFHEAGHVIFSFLGDFIRVLGGTLMQILVPLVCIAAFVKKGDPFGASFALWWMGQSFIDAAPYIYDARAGELMLLGGVTGQDAPDFHDWHNMLRWLGLLPYDHAVAYLSRYTGVFFMVASFLWGGYTLRCQYRSLRKGEKKNQGR
jgi:hypothetical protein